MVRSARTTLCFTVCLYVFAGSLFGKEEIGPRAAELFKRYVIAHPEMEYPYAARLHFIEGKGRYRIIADRETGAVTEVIIESSTGHPVLDDAAVANLRRWRLRPHTTDTIVIPYTFEMQGWVAEKLHAARKYATYSPYPVAPLKARRDLRGGEQECGWYQLSIDQKTGRVTDLKIVVQSHSTLLDREARKMFLQWRFIPNTVRSVTLPVRLRP